MHLESNSQLTPASSISRFGRSALAYAALGIRILPLIPRGKVPILHDWGNRATLLRETVTDWWGEWPEANIGGATGRGLAVLDVDPAHGGFVALEGLEEAHGSLPLTPTVKTGSGGLHYWFRLPDGLRLGNSAGKLGPGLDIRGDGGQVVLPPSIHPNGSPYSWLGEARIGEVPFAPMPSWMLAELTDGVTRSKGTLAPQVWAQLLTKKVEHPDRTPTLTRIIGHLLGHGLAPDEVLALALAWNARWCSPPLEEDQVGATLAGILKTRLRAMEAAGGR